MRFHFKADVRLPPFYPDNFKSRLDTVASYKIKIIELKTKTIPPSKNKKGYTKHTAKIVLMEDTRNGSWKQIGMSEFMLFEIPVALWDGVLKFLHEADKINVVDNYCEFNPEGMEIEFKTEAYNRTAKYTVLNAQLQDESMVKL